MVQAEFKGTGSKKIMLIAHMDTVYLNGMLKDQPFRIDGDKAYGLGIADDKQGIALILHTVAMLQKLELQGLRHADRADQRRRGDQLAGLAQHHHPRGRATRTRCSRSRAAATTAALRLATSGIGAAYLTVEGKASHAGAAPERGVNALYELSHQMLQMSDLSQHEQGLKLNWTVSQAGTNRNVIPARGHGAGRRARAERRRLRPSCRRRCRSAIKNQLHARRQGAAQVRGAPPAAGSHRTPRAAWPRTARRSTTRSAAAEGAGGRHRRRHRRRVRRAEDQGRRWSRASA